MGGLFIFISALTIVGFGWSTHHTKQAFKDHGKIAIVEPIGKYQEVTKTKGGKVVEVYYTADLQFNTEAGQHITIHRSFSNEMLEKFKAGEEVTLKYLPEHPDQTSLDVGRNEDESLFDSIWMGLVGVGISLVMAMMRIFEPIVPD